MITHVDVGSAFRRTVCGAVGPAEAGPHILQSCIVAMALVLHASLAAAQITAQIRPAPKPSWSKGILPISRESYYNAMECGKQGGQDPPCVFWDTGICKNDDFQLAFYTPYKMVAYDVWNAVRQKQAAPTPNYAEAQRTRITVGVTPVRGSKNAFSDLILKRDGKTVAAAARSPVEGGMRITYDYAAWAATAGITLDIVGKAKTISCVIDRTVLAQMR
jgi:hypothetical protein